MLFNILITDDNLIHQISVKYCIEEFNYNPLVAFNGAEAIDIIKSKNVDLIILDLQMPVMDGFEFLDWLKDHEEYSNIPVVVYSGMADTDTVEQVLQYNVFGYYFKPITQIDQLLFSNAIKSALNFRKNTVELAQANKIIDNFINKKKANPFE